MPFAAARLLICIAQSFRGLKFPATFFRPFGAAAFCRSSIAPPHPKKQPAAIITTLAPSAARFRTPATRNFNQRKQKKDHHAE